MYLIEQRVAEYLFTNLLAFFEEFTCQSFSRHNLALEKLNLPKEMTGETLLK